MSAVATLHGTLTLGELIDALKVRPPDQHVYFNFCHLRPDDLASYRGYYDHLAIGYRNAEPDVTVKELLKELRAAVGKTYEGYKGGFFTMRRNTPVWVSQWGDCDSTTIVGVSECEYETILLTGYEAT